MKNTQNLTIVFLLVTAAILSSLLVAGYVGTSQPAYAATAQSKGGDYIMTSGSLNQESDFIYVIDIAHNMLAVYYANINTNSLMVGDKVDLSKAFAATKP